jgi:hypothetical protein
MSTCNNKYKEINSIITEEGIFEVEAISNLLVSQNNMTILPQKKTSNNLKENKNVLYKLSQDKS